MAPPSTESSQTTLPPDGADDGEERSPLGIRKRSRWLPLVVAFGALLAGAPLAEEVSDRREVVIRLEEPAPVTALSVTLLSGSDVIWGTERRFAPGQAPDEVTRSLPLSAGRYRVLLELDDGGEPKRLERLVNVEDDVTRVVIPVP
jgi:hypothetical protein